LNIPNNIDRLEELGLILANTELSMQSRYEQVTKTLPAISSDTGTDMASFVSANAEVVKLREAYEALCGDVYGGYNGVLERIEFLMGGFEKTNFYLRDVPEAVQLIGELDLIFNIELEKNSLFFSTSVCERYLVLSSRVHVIASYFKETGPIDNLELQRHVGDYLCATTVEVKKAAAHSLIAVLRSEQCRLVFMGPIPPNYDGNPQYYEVKRAARSISAWLKYLSRNGQGVFSPSYYRRVFTIASRLIRKHEKITKMVAIDDIGALTRLFVSELKITSLEIAVERGLDEDLIKKVDDFESWLKVRDASDSKKRETREVNDHARSAMTRAATANETVAPSVLVPPIPMPPQDTAPRVKVPRVTRETATRVIRGEESNEFVADEEVSDGSAADADDDDSSAAELHDNQRRLEILTEYVGNSDEFLKWVHAHYGSDFGLFQSGGATNECSNVMTDID